MDSKSEDEDSCQQEQQASHFIHILENVKMTEYECLHKVLRSQLTEFGLDLSPHKGTKRESRSKIKATPNSESKADPDLFLHCTDVKLSNSENVVVEVPKFLDNAIRYIRNHLDKQGLFRVAGNYSRVNCLAKNLEKGISFENLKTESVFDVCSALKQLLRKMKESLIPGNVEEILLSCLDLPDKIKSEAVSLTVLLLPKNHLHILLFLMEFLNEVSKHAEKNKMDVTNLAIVFAPTIMRPQQLPSKLGKDTEHVQKLIQQTSKKQADIVKILIEMGDKLGYLSEKVHDSLINALSRGSEDELSEREGEGDGRKRKRRSASLNRVIDFLRKKKIGKHSNEANSSISKTNGTVFTPGSYQTPVIITSSRKRTDQTPMSSVRKNRIWSAVQKKNPLGSYATPTLKPGISAAATPINLNPMGKMYDIQDSTKNVKPRGRQLRDNNDKIILNNGVQQFGKSSIPIISLSKSPKPPSSAGSTSRGTSETSSHLGLTPMVKEINSLTLAALELNSTQIKKGLKSSPKLCKTPLSARSVVSHTGPILRSATRDKCTNQRRCQSYNGPPLHMRKMGPKRRRSDGIGRPKSKNSPEAQMHKILRSPNRCTLRRGRPNTMRVGLSRPSPNHSTSSPSISSTTTTSSSKDKNNSPFDETPKNITMDRKGRVSKRVCSRPALVIPPVSQMKNNKAKSPPEKPKRNFVKRTLSKKENEGGGEEVGVGNKTPVGTKSYVASKLKREEDGTVKMKFDGVTSTTDSPSRHKGRSFSLRSDMMRPSPAKYAVIPHIAGSGIPTRQGGGEGRGLKRGISVQELVKKFDSCSSKESENSNPLLTLRRTRTINRNPPSSSAIPKLIPPPKPIRAAISNNNTTNYSSRIGEEGLKNDSYFNSIKKFGARDKGEQFENILTRSGSKTSFIIKNKVLKTNAYN